MDLQPTSPPVHHYHRNPALSLTQILGGFNAGCPIHCAIISDPRQAVLIGLLAPARASSSAHTMANRSRHKKRTRLPGNSFRNCSHKFNGHLMHPSAGNFIFIGAALTTYPPREALIKWYFQKHSNTSFVVPARASLPRRF
jgi:hypothetical protein